MKHKREPFFRLTVAMVAGLLSGSAGAIDPSEFAVGWSLELPVGTEFYDIPLSAETYSNARSVSQMAILDANDDPMPFYRVNVESEPALDELITFSVSPVFQTQGGELIEGLTVETTDEVVSLRFGAEATDRTQIAAFVADTRELELRPGFMDLDWAEVDRPFLTSVAISHSEDLYQWDVIGRGTIASLELDGSRVRHSRIPIDGRTGGYYRINGTENTPSPWVLEEIGLVIAAEPGPAPVELVSLSPIAVPENAPENALFFDAGGFLPARAVELGFGQPNRWTNAVVHGSDSLDGPWRRIISSQLFYRVEFEGRQLSAPPLEVARRGVRYWKVQPDRALDQGDIELRLHYPQERLRFAANGSAPYQLVGGGLSTEAGPDSAFPQVWGQLDEDRMVSIARLGPRYELGGDAAFLAPSEFPWRTGLLWAALLLGALTVGWMAVRLGREAFAGE